MEQAVFLASFIGCAVVVMSSSRVIGPVAASLQGQRVWQCVSCVVLWSTLCTVLLTGRAGMAVVTDERRLQSWQVKWRARDAMQRAEISGVVYDSVLLLRRD